MQRFNKVLFLTFLSVRRIIFLFCIISINALADGVARSEVAPAYLLLQRMVDANKQLSYTGTFTYEYGGALKTAKVVHVVKDGREYERLIHLNGPTREVIRQGDDISCQRVGDKLLHGMAYLDVGRESSFSDFYDLFIKGKNRVAGRVVTVVHVVPKDNHRYGYALSLDHETGLPLQSMLVGQGKKVLERFQFVDIHIGAFIDEAELVPTNSDHYVAELEHSPCVKGELPEYKGEWMAGWLPPGFVLTGGGDDEELGRSSLIFTDGLAVFSIFIDDDQHLKIPEVQAQRGATVAFLMHYESSGQNYSVSVVGEIPPVIARRVAQSVKFRD